MKKRSIALIIGLMSFALLGVMGMQFYFLRQSYQMQSELFDRSVNEALNNVAAKISKQDANNFLNIKAFKSNLNQNTFTDKLNKGTPDRNDTYNHTVEKNKTVSAKKLTLRQKKITLLRDSLRRMIAHKKMDDNMIRLMQGRSIDLQLHYEEFTDDFGIVHGRVTPVIVRNTE